MLFELKLTLSKSYEIDWNQWLLKDHRAAKQWLHFILSLYSYLYGSTYQTFYLFLLTFILDFWFIIPTYYTFFKILSEYEKNIEIIQSNSRQRIKVIDSGDWQSEVSLHPLLCLGLL